MELVMKPKYQYYLMIFSFVPILFIAIGNYIKTNNQKKAIKTIITTLIISFVNYSIIPIILSETIEVLFHDLSITGIYIIVYSYAFSLYLILDQQKFFKNQGVI